MGGGQQVGGTGVFTTYNKFFHGKLTVVTDLSNIRRILQMCMKADSRDDIPSLTGFGLRVFRLNPVHERGR